MDIMTKQSQRFTRDTRRTKKRVMSESEKHAMYVRRRIFVGVIALFVLVIACFCVFSIAKGISYLSSGLFSFHEVNISRKSVPDPRPASLTRDCTSQDLRLELSSKNQNVAMGGSLDFTARIIFVGKGSCLVDASNNSLVMAISDTNSSDTSKDESKDNSDEGTTENSDKNSDKNSEDLSKNSDKNSDEENKNDIWRSDVCVAPSKPLLMTQGDHFDEKFTWDTNATRGVGCTEKDNMPKVDRGSYLVRLYHKNISGLHSDSLVVNVK